MTSESLSVMFATAPAPVGGLERVVQAQAIGLARRGHRTCVVATLGESETNGHPFVETLRAADVPVHVVPVGRGGYLDEWRQLRGLIALIRPDVLHTHGYRSDLLGITAVKGRTLPIVSTMHGSSRMGGLSHAFEWMQQRAWRRFDAAIAVSGALADLHRRHGGRGRNVEVIPNAWSGVEPRLSSAQARARLRLPALAPDIPVLGFVARLIPAKGPDVFVESLAALADQPWHAVLVGAGGERAALETLIEARGLAGRVTLAGHVDDATDLYAAFDVFVLSSRTEGTPIALFEAMAASRPIVATEVGGVPDVVGAGAALLVPPENPVALAAAISRLLAAPSDAAHLGQAARARVVGDYGPDHWLARHETIYRRVVADAKGRHS